MRLRNKVALVTGAASGFGAEIARLFAAEGAFVAVVDLNEAGARSISTEIGNAASPIKCDVAVGPEVRNAVETTQEIFGRLDIVVNNAGTTHRNKPMLEVTQAEFDKVYAVNATRARAFARSECDKVDVDQADRCGLWHPSCWIVLRSSKVQMPKRAANP
jgi:NAD(P)-dependent dehydrogenase (short-subunit alcohol dehydrogenase family)